jgi:signal transduction histidine kinase
MERDPKGAIALIKAELSGKAVTSGAGAGAARARLYAMLVDAYQNAGDIAAARAAAALGLESLTTADADDSGLRRRLQLTGIKLLEQQGQIDRAATEYEQASASVRANAPDFVCVLGDRGYLRYLVGRPVDAAVDAINAYRLARDQGHHEIQLAAGQLLARLYSQYGVYDDALALADEAVAFYAHSPKQALLSDAYLFRGDVLFSLGKPEAADADFLKSRALLQSIDDPVALSFTQQRLCKVAAEMVAHRADAPTVCHAAYEIAEAVKNPVSVKIALAELGRIEFAKGHARGAILLWDRVLANDGIDIPKDLRAEVYGLRGRARAQVADAVGALRDTDIYVESLQEDRKTRSAGQVALLNAKFTIALKDEEIARVRAEASATELVTSQRAFIRNLVAATASATIAIGAGLFGAWLWHRRKLALDARNAAEERLAAIGRLTGGVAHDFNNLVNVLQQAIGLLARRETVARDAGAVDLIQQARRASELCADITSQLLSVSRQQNLKPEAVEMEGYLRDVLPLLERAAGPTIKVVVEVREPKPVAWVDRRQLTAALLNLATNARDAMGDAGVLAVRASAQANRRTRIDVVDEGCGMTPEVLARAVEPFYSTKAVGKGSGLGLSMVQGFAAQSGGSLEIASAPNQGTTVSLWLPAEGAST